MARDMNYAREKRKLQAMRDVLRERLSRTKLDLRATMAVLRSMAATKRRQRKAAPAVVDVVVKRRTKRRSRSQPVF